MKLLHDKCLSFTVPYALHKVKSLILASTRISINHHFIDLEGCPYSNLWPCTSKQLKRVTQPGMQEQSMP